MLKWLVRVVLPFVLIERQKLLEKRVFTSTVFLDKVKNEVFGSMPDPLPSFLWAGEGKGSGGVTRASTTCSSHPILGWRF